MSRNSAMKMSNMFLRQLRPNMFTGISSGRFGMVSSPMAEARCWSTKATDDRKEEIPLQTSAGTATNGSENGATKGIVSYWGVPPSTITKEDGSPWRWNCFRVCIYIYSRIVNFLEKMKF